MAEGYKRTALFRSKKAVSCKDATTVDGFAVSGREPSGTERRVVFSHDGETWFKLAISDGTATPTNVATQSLTDSSVLTEGNTADELTTVTSIPSFVGTSVYMAAALSAPEDSLVAPATTETEGSGTVSVEIRFYANEAWGDYMAVSDVSKSEIIAQKAQFRARYGVSVLASTDMAKVKGATITYRTTSVGKFVDGTGILVTKTYDFGNTITRAHLMVKRKLVDDTRISAQISLRPAIQQVTGEVLGVGTGAQQTVTLQNTTNLAAHGFYLYFDGVAQAEADYSYSVSDGQVTFTAPEGVAVTVDYIYDWTEEVFADFDRDTSYPDKEDSELVDEQFDYTAAEEGKPTGSVGTVRLLLEQLSGEETNVVLGTGTGYMQAFQLPHHAKSDTITLTPSSCQFYYDDDTDVLKLIAPNGAEVKISYEWIGRPVSVESMVCIFNE